MKSLEFGGSSIKIIKHVVKTFQFIESIKKIIKYAIQKGL